MAAANAASADVPAAYSASTNMAAAYAAHAADVASAHTAATTATTATGVCTFNGDGKKEQAAREGQRLQRYEFS